MRNRFNAPCYECGATVEAGTGHPERHGYGWRVKHANVAGLGRITCEQAAAGRAAGRAAKTEKENSE